MCKECEKNPVYEFTNQRKLCRVCFIRYFQKKFLHTIRKFKMIGKRDVVSYITNKSFQGVVLEDVLEMFSEKTNVDLVKFPTKKRINKVAVSNTLDLESNEIVNSLIKGKTSDLKKSAPVLNKTIKPLYLFTDEEVLLYAKLKKLKFKIEKEKKDEIGKFINELEKKHPEIKRAIVNSYLKLNYNG